MADFRDELHLCVRWIRDPGEHDSRVIRRLTDTHGPAVYELVEYKLLGHHRCVHVLQEDLYFGVMRMLYLRDVSNISQLYIQ